MRTILNRNRLLVALVFISLLPLIPLVQRGMFIAHDSQDHVARIANFYQNLKEGVLIPRWAGNLNWGYGHPILMFLYPLPSYLASLFIFLGFSLASAAKLVFAMGFLGSGIAMYLWIRKLYGDVSGFTAAVLYMFAPYRFVDLYVRGAIGENLFFIFPPLVCYFFTRIVRRLQWADIAGASISIAGMVLSHNALTIMFLPFIVAYGGVLLRERKGIREIGMLVSSGVLGFGLSAFFWIPAFMEGKYTLRDIVTKNELFNRFETFGRILYSPWAYGGTGQFSVAVGFIQWGIILVAPLLLYYVYRKKKTRFQFDTSILMLSFLFFWIAVFFILPLSEPVYETITTLQKFQFPWRWLSLAIFPPAIIAGYLVSLVPQKIRIYAAIIGVLLVVIPSVEYWHPKGFSDKPQAFYTSVYEGTTDTGESAPIWSVRFMLTRPLAFAQVVEGDGTLTMVGRKTTRHVYELESQTQHVKILENTLYFPGWVVSVDGNKLPITELFFQDPTYRGLINFTVNGIGKHVLEIKFGETKLRLFADILSAVSAILVAALLLRKKVFLYEK